MYAFLSRYLPRTLADTAMVIWYTVLIGLVAYFSLEPQAEFNYLTL